MVLNQSPPLLVPTDLACILHMYFADLLYFLHCNFTHQWSRTSEQSAVRHINFCFTVVKRSRFIFRSQPGSISGITFCKVSFLHYCLLQWPIISCMRSRKFSWMEVLTCLFTWKNQTLVPVLPLFYWKLRVFSADTRSSPGLYSGCKSSICNWNSFFCLWNSFLHHWHQWFTACFGKREAGGLCLHKHWKLLIFLSIFAGIHLLLGFLQHYLQSLIISLVAKMLQDLIYWVQVMILYSNYHQKIRERCLLHKLFLG